MRVCPLLNEKLAPPSTLIPAWLPLPPADSAALASFPSFSPVK